MLIGLGLPASTEVEDRGAVRSMGRLVAYISRHGCFALYSEHSVSGLAAGLTG